MFYLRRNDVYLRNEWSNYSNWPYHNVLPNDINRAPIISDLQFNGVSIGPAYNFKDLSGGTTSTNIYITPELSVANVRDILSRLSIIFDGQYRETDLDAGVYNYVSKYKMSHGSSNDGLYCYNYTLNTGDIQPSGAINLSKFKTIEIELSTLVPLQNTSVSSKVFCDAEGIIVGVSSKDPLYEYTYDLYLIEERYNILRFIGGNAGLLYAR